MNQPVVITGCQRSGTTLLHLILDSHPRVKGVDEDAYVDGLFSEYLHSAEFAEVVAFKLPRVAWNLDFLRAFPNVRILWCIRDPRDVVWSMISLHLHLSDTLSVSWAAHPLGAEYELHYSFRRLPPDTQKELKRVFGRFRRSVRKEPFRRSLDELVLAAALCWRVKNELTTLYADQEICHRHVYYEHLVGNPESEIGSILEFLGLPWSDRVMQHHLHHSGLSIGNTENTRPIDRSSTNKWVDKLSENHINMIRDVCGQRAAAFGYAL